MIIPNVDGEYKTRDGKVRVTITRKEITLDITRQDDCHIIEENNDRPRKRNTEEKLDNVMNVINKTSKILMG